MYRATERLCDAPLAIRLVHFQNTIFAIRNEYSQTNAITLHDALNEHLVTCKLLNTSDLEESVRSVLKKSTIFNSVTR